MKKLKQMYWKWIKLPVKDFRRWLAYIIWPKYNPGKMQLHYGQLMVEQLQKTADDYDRWTPDIPDFRHAIVGFDEVAIIPLWITEDMEDALGWEDQWGKFEGRLRTTIELLEDFANLASTASEEWAKYYNDVEFCRAFRADEWSTEEELLKYVEKTRW